MNRADSPAVAPTALPHPTAAARSEEHLAPLATKVKPIHLARAALVYVRQSTAQQVLNHRESTARQYELDRRAVQLGWSPEAVVIVDEDQAQSGRTADGRSGFAYLLSEVALNHVGIILGLETSRLARSNKDWHQLLEVCSIFQTLIADQDGVYDPTQYNDRLLLGLKGTMSEAELHLLRSRRYDGLLHKARRGAVYNHPPIGYVKGPEGRFTLDPDEQVQGVVRLIFAQFERQGTVCGLLRWLVQHQIQVPVRPHQRDQRGQLQWRRPNRVTLQSLLHHPIYAGFYRFGHRAVDPRKKVSGKRQSGRTLRAPHDCLVLLPNHCPAYISPEQFWANQERLQQNRARADTRGAPRQGPALLSGLLRCGRCGYRMVVNYNNAHNGLRYNCLHALVCYGEPDCQSLAGRCLDAFVSEQVLAALEPAALALHLAAAADVEQQRQELHQHWQQQLERARYTVERAGRQYAQVEPENRLVARTLASNWEAALQEQERLQREYDQFCATRPATLSAAEREQVRELAAHIPALWSAATTTAIDRQKLIRLLIDEIVVTVEGQSEQVQAAITWAGGFVSEHRLLRPVRSYAQLSDYPQLCARIAAWRAAGRSLREVAEQLNAEGFRPPKRVARFTGAMLAELLARQAAARGQGRDAATAGGRRRGEWLLGDLARQLGMPAATLHHWRKAGWVHARKLAAAGGQWAIWAPRSERQRLTRLRRHQQSKPNQAIPVTLTTPAPPTTK